MRRVSTNYVKPGMVLGRAVYDSGGYVVLESGSSLDAESLAALKIGGVGEVFIHDDRLLDVPVSPMFPPELEGQVTQGMTQLITESQGESRVQDGLIQFLTAPLYGMIRVLFPEPLGEINAGGCLSADDFRYAQPVKVAGLSLLMGKRLGYGISELASLGMAALLKDVGYNVLPQGIADGPQSSEEGELGRVREHPSHGAKILAQSGDFDPEVIRGVLQHHERWDGGGYPGGLKGPDISSIAGIVSIADSYYELVSVRPWKPALMPHEAVEYIMAYSGEMFDQRWFGSLPGRHLSIPLESTCSSPPGKLPS